MSDRVLSLCLRLLSTRSFLVLLSPLCCCSSFLHFFLSFLSVRPSIPGVTFDVLWMSLKAALPLPLFLLIISGYLRGMGVRKKFALIWILLLRSPVVSSHMVSLYNLYSSFHISIIGIYSFFLLIISIHIILFPRSILSIYSSIFSSTSSSSRFLIGLGVC